MNVWAPDDLCVCTVEASVELSSIEEAASESPWSVGSNQVMVFQLMEWSRIDSRVGGLQPDSFSCPTVHSGAGLKPVVKWGWLRLEGRPMRNVRQLNAQTSWKEHECTIKNVFPSPSVIQCSLNTKSAVLLPSPSPCCLQSVPLSVHCSPTYDSLWLCERGSHVSILYLYSSSLACLRETITLLINSNVTTDR